MPDKRRKSAKLTEPQRRELIRLRIGPRRCIGKSTVLVQNNLARLGLVRLTTDDGREVDITKPYALADVATITDAGLSAIAKGAS